MADTGPAARSEGKCPICGAPRAADYRPFCSRRCADVDLLRWLNGSYAIASMADDEEDGEPSPQAPPPKRTDEENTD